MLNLNIKTVLHSLCALVFLAGAAKAADLRVVVYDLTNTDGTVSICLWRHDAGFPECNPDEVFRHATVKPLGPSLVWTFSEIPPGTYAVSAAHDQNGDGELQRHWLFGYPTEGAGVSNVTEPQRRAPRFDEAHFLAVDGVNEVTVQMFYPD